MNGVRWKHKKTGNEYRILDFVIIEKTLTPGVCYEPVVEPGGLFVRPCAEFFDGRFEMIDMTYRDAVPKGPATKDHVEPTEKLTAYAPRRGSSALS